MRGAARRLFRLSLKPEREPADDDRVPVLLAVLPIAALASAGRLLAAGSEPTRRKIAEAESPSLPPPTLRSSLVSFVAVLAALALLLAIAH